MRRIMLSLLATCLIIMYLPAQSLFRDAGKEAGEENSRKSDLLLKGYVRGVVFGGGEQYDLAASFAEIALSSGFKSHGAFMNADIRLRKGNFFRNDVQLIQLKELYGGYSGNKLDLLLGNQIVNWGRTDGFNPTDNISPKDYFFLSPDPDDQRSSNFLLRTRYRFTDAIQLDVVAIPFYQPSVYRYELFDMGNMVSFEKQQLPEKKLKNGSVAARLNFDYSVAGFSLSYFRGYDPYHGFDVAKVDWSTGQPAIINRPEAYLKNSLGFDLAVPLNRLVFRVEAAWNITDNPEGKMYVPNSDFYYVGALETNVAGTTLIAQYIGRYVLDFADLELPVLLDPLSLPAQMQYANEMIDYENRLFNRRIFYQQEKMNHAVSLSVSKSFGYDAWELMCTGYYNLTSAEWLVQPKLTFKVNDALSATIGGNYMQGSSKTLFGYASKLMNGIFVGLKVNF